MILVTSLKGTGKLLSKAQNGAKTTIYASRGLETMFRVYALSVRPSGKGQHVKQPQKSASHDVATVGILTELRMTLLDQTRPGTWSWRGMPLARSARACGDGGLPYEPSHCGWNADSRAVKLPRLNTLTNRVEIVNCKLAGAKRQNVIDVTYFGRYASSLFFQTIL